MVDPVEVLITGRPLNGGLGIRNRCVFASEGQPHALSIVNRSGLQGLMASLTVTCASVVSALLNLS